MCFDAASAYTSKLDQLMMHFIKRYLQSHFDIGMIVVRFWLTTYCQALSRDIKLDMDMVKAQTTVFMRDAYDDFTVCYTVIVPLQAHKMGFDFSDGRGGSFTIRKVHIVREIDRRGVYYRLLSSKIRFIHFSLLVEGYFSNVRTTPKFIQSLHTILRGISTQKS